MKPTDISIDGHGFYQMQATSPRGKRFLTHVEGTHDGIAYCDDTRLTQAIADGHTPRGCAWTSTACGTKGEASQ